MRKTLITIAILSAAFLMLPGLVYGDSAGAVGSHDVKANSTVKMTPPARPVPLTASQYSGLKLVQAQPEHSKVLDASATYSAREEQLKWTRFSDDVWTAIYQVGWPGAYLAVLLCAI